MPSPFPGMDPYLENPSHWRSFHNSFLLYLQLVLNRDLPEGFLAQNEARVYISTSRQPMFPDVSVFATASARQPRYTGERAMVAERVDAPEIIPGEEQNEVFLNVIDNRQGEMEVVAVIEILSPTNKTERNEGYTLYRRKQQQICESGIHLLEIDLLRSGAYTVRVPEEVVRGQGKWDYLITLYDATMPSSWIFWRVDIKSHLPALHLPLTHDVPPVRVDLQAVLNRYFDDNRVTVAMDYTADPIPPLSPDDMAWADALLREKGFRK